MPTLGLYKTKLLEQLRNQDTLELATLTKLLQQYDDLTVADLRQVISPALYDSLLDAARDPMESAMWSGITSGERSTEPQIRALQQKLQTYLSRFPSSPKLAEAQALATRLQADLIAAGEEARRAEEARREQSAWSVLDRHSYGAMLGYRSRYPQSVHLDEIDDACWDATRAAITPQSLSRYIADWPCGRHYEEAASTMAQFDSWGNVRGTGNLYQVADYRTNNSDSLLRADIDRVYYELRERELRNMKECPNEYDKESIRRLMDTGIFSRYELIDEGLMTDESWDTLNSDIREYLPEVSQFQLPDPDLKATVGCTDIYLFGTPGTGKTCLLMGLAGANGQGGYMLNMRVHGGPYASALQQFVNAGLTPGRTFGSYVTVINGAIEGQRGRKNVTYPINLVEMSGEEFALHISENREVSLADMGTGATNLLTNNNRKAFFIIVDATKDQIKFEYEETVRDEQGNAYDVRRRKRYISQLDIINKFVGLFTLPENSAIMEKVDAIHFIVTKADILGEPMMRDQRAKDLLTSLYSGPVATLKSYCRQSKRINYATSYVPHLFTFSLGKFYLGDVFRFNNADTLKIVEAMRQIINPVREQTWWDRFKEALR